MKYKYIIISGLASNEEEDMLKLRKYASKGWILDSISYGFFYKLKKDVPQDIIYTIDYQNNVTEDYYLIFKQAGWNHVTSIENKIHIFSAPKGTTSIYSDSETELNKYNKIRIKTKKGVIFSSIISILFLLIIFPSILISKLLFITILLLFMVNIIILIFNLIPYLSYSDRIKQLKINESYKEHSNNKLLKIYIFGTILASIAFLINLVTKKHISIFLIIITMYMFYLSFKSLNTIHKKDNID